MANNYNEIMKIVNQGNKMGLSNTITRDNGIPLDLSSVHATYNDAIIYAATKAIAYQGQILAAEGVAYLIVAESQGQVEIEGTNYDNYLKPIGTIPGFDEAENGTVAIKQDGSLVWRTLEEIGAGDGNDNTTYTFTGLLNEANEVYGISVQAYFNGQALGEAIEIPFTVYTKAEADAKFLAIADKYDDTALAGRVKAIEADYLKAEDKTALEGQIDAIANKVDTGDATVSEYVAAEIGKKIHIRTEVVDAIPSVDDAEEGVIYLVAADNATGTYIEYILVEKDGVKSVEQIGDTTTDLSNYYTKEEIAGLGYATTESVNTALADKADKSTLADYYTADEVDAKGYAIADEVAETYAKSADVYTKDEVYSKSETDTAIADAVKNATGGESASDVLIELNNYKKAVNREIWGSEEVADYTATASRLDSLEDADAAQDALIASNTTLAQQGVDDAATAKSVADGVAAQAATNKSDISALNTQISSTNENVSKNAGDIASLSATVTSNKTTTDAKIAGLETADTEINKNIAANATAIEALQSKDTELLAKFDGYYTKTEADNAVKAVTGEVASDTTLVAMINAKADQSTTYTKDEVDGLLENLDQTEINEAIQANTDAIAILVGEVAGDDAKSVRDIAAEETAKIVAGADTDYDTLKEIADFIKNDTTGAAAMANNIAALQAKVDTGDKTVSAYVTDAIAAAAYDLPAATKELLGGVKLSDEVGVNDAGQLEIKSLSTDKLVQGANEILFNCGTASGMATQA